MRSRRERGGVKVGSGHPVGDPATEGRVKAVRSRQHEPCHGLDDEEQEDNQHRQSTDRIVAEVVLGMAGDECRDIGLQRREVARSAFAFATMT